MKLNRRIVKTILKKNGNPYDVFNFWKKGADIIGEILRTYLLTYVLLLNNSALILTNLVLMQQGDMKLEIIPELRSKHCLLIFSWLFHDV